MIRTSRPPADRRWATGFALVLLAWTAVEATLARPTTLAAGWLGWRQADTQTMARNFHRHGESILMPRIAWGGDGPGYVDAEFQLYSWVVGSIQSLTGEAEWPGQILSLVLTAAAAAVIYRIFARRFGSLAGFFGGAAFLSSRVVSHLATAVAPDPLCVFFYVVSLAAFLRWVDEEQGGDLMIAFLFATLAALVKPPALHLGIVQFALVLFAKPRLLKRPALWGAWIGIVGIVAAYLAHSRSIYLEHGNSFGIVSSGSDTKFPGAAQLVDPQVWLGLAKVTLTWGLGPLGLLAGLWVLIRRGFGAREAALAIGNIAMLLVALRYTWNEGAGAHYHVFILIFGAWLVAAAAAIVWRDVAHARLRLAIFAILGVVLLGQYALGIRRFRQVKYPVECATGERLRALAERDDLVILRSRAAVNDEFWNRRNNFEDPRVFYVADVRGWILPRDEARLEEARSHRERGARFYVELGTEPTFPEVVAWLGDVAEPVVQEPGAWIWRFHD